MIIVIELIISIIGILGVCSSNLPCILIGLVGIILFDLFDILLTKRISFFTIIAILGGVVASFIYKKPLYSFTIFLCCEKIIETIYITYNFIKSKTQTKKTYTNAWEERMDTLYSNKRKGTFLKDVKLKK